MTNLVAKHLTLVSRPHGPFWHPISSMQPLLSLPHPNHASCSHTLTRTTSKMASRNTAIFLLGPLLFCVAMSSAARILEEVAAPSKDKEHLPELPTLPKVELPPLPEVHLPPKPELPKVELPPFPEFHLPSKPELPKVELPPFPEFHLPSKPELPKVELPSKPGVPEFHFPEPEAKP